MLHGIQHSKCKNIINYIRQIKDAGSEIKDVKISIDDAIVIHALNNFDSQFCPYLLILNYEAQQKAKLPTLLELIKNVEDDELRLKNVSTTSGNFAKKVNQSWQVTEIVQILAKNRLKIWIRKTRSAKHVVIIITVTIGIWQQSIFSVIKPATSQQIAQKIKRKKCQPLFLL